MVGDASVGTAASATGTVLDLIAIGATLALLVSYEMIRAGRSPKKDHQMSVLSLGIAPMLAAVTIIFLARIYVILR
jgi:hypothetical protein